MPVTVTRSADTPDSRGAEHRERVKRRARAHFDSWAASYDHSLLNQIVFYPTIRTCQEEIVRWQQQRGPAPYGLLDVGCGTGTLLSMLAADPHAEQLVGLDYSPEMVRRAADKCAGCDPQRRLEIVHADAEHLPFADGAFDILTCCNSFHHYPHPAAVINGFWRVLRPGGLLILIDGFRDNVIGWVVFDVFVAAIERHVRHLPWSEFRKLIEQAGFRELRQRKMNVLAPLLVNVGMR